VWYTTSKGDNLLPWGTRATRRVGSCTAQLYVRAFSVYHAGESKTLRNANQTPRHRQTLLVLRTDRPGSSRARAGAGADSDTGAIGGTHSQSATQVPHRAWGDGPFTSSTTPPATSHRRRPGLVALFPSRASLRAHLPSGWPPSSPRSRTHLRPTPASRLRHSSGSLLMNF
jgi:hypothetical protein